MPVRRRATRVPPPRALEADTAADEGPRGLARAVHDRVAQTRSTMLFEIEEFRAGQYGRVGVLQQLDLLEGSTRKALTELRKLLVALRAQTVDEGEGDLAKLIKDGLQLRQR